MSSKITKANLQFRVSIPKEIIELKGWDENTELIFVPLLQDPSKEVSKDTPIIIKEFKKAKK
tara:strand:+ start:4110 stop:4295 length:186 start_codon:yes stop_codon:yes gene_type:complete